MVDWFERLFVAGMLAATAALLIALGWAIYSDVSADRFTLRTDAWRCSSAHQEERLILIGKVLVPRTEMVCDQYTAR